MHTIFRWQFHEMHYSKTFWNMRKLTPKLMSPATDRVKANHQLFLSSTFDDCHGNEQNKRWVTALKRKKCRLAPGIYQHHSMQMEVFSWKLHGRLDIRCSIGIVEVVSPYTYVSGLVIPGVWLTWQQMRVEGGGESLLFGYTHVVVIIILNTEYLVFTSAVYEMMEWSISISKREDIKHWVSYQIADFTIYLFLFYFFYFYNMTEKYRCIQPHF